MSIYQAIKLILDAAKIIADIVIANKNNCLGK